MFKSGSYKLPPPLQNVQYFDRRIMTIDTPDSDRFITSEKKNLVVDSFVKWRITDPKLYYVSVQGREADAVYRIQQSLKDALNNEIGKRTVNEMVSGVRDKVMQDISAKVNDAASRLVERRRPDGSNVPRGRDLVRRARVHE